MTNFKIKALLGTSVFLLAACGGGSSSSAPTPTVTVAPNQAPIISGTPGVATESVAYSFTPTASDPDGDPLSFSVENLPAWMDFNASTGELSGTPSSEDVAIYSGLAITVSDGTADAELRFDVEVVEDTLEAALRTGDVSKTNGEEDILAAILETIEADKDLYTDTLNTLFAVSDTGTSDPIDWDPSHDSSMLSASFGRNTPLFTTTHRTRGGKEVLPASDSYPLAVLGETEASRYLVFGGNPMRNAYGSSTSVSPSLESFLERSVAWLAGREATADAPYNVVIAQTSDSYYFPDERANRAWLDTRFDGRVSYNSADVCDGAALSGCLEGADLLIISQVASENDDVDAIVETVSEAMEAGLPVLYMHHNGNLTDLGRALFALMDVTYVGDNYWPHRVVEGVNPIDEIGALPLDVAAYKALAENFQTDSFDIDFSLCEDRSCEEGSRYTSEFGDAVTRVKASVDARDVTKRNAFEGKGGTRLERLMILLADDFRQSVSFPMDKTTTPTGEFLRSLYADHVVHTGRALNPAQSEMGNFGRSDFSHVSPETVTIEREARQPFRAAGVYALPGQTFTVTRTDGTEVATSVQINTLRSGATHEYQTDGYARPKHLTSSAISIAPGETVSLTSPYGGPIQIRFNGSGDNTQFRFENVGRHAFWNGPEDNQTFAAAIDAADYDWVEIAAPNFEIHSRADRMEGTLEETSGDIEKLSADISRYIQDLPHALAGFQGEGITGLPEALSFAADYGIEISSYGGIKHMNADQALCGYGCSGNPYDAYWSFSPLGHGDLHELGHGLERTRMRFERFELHATTNYYSYHSKYRAFLEGVSEDETQSRCQSISYQTAYDMIQVSRNETDPMAYMRDQELTVWQDGKRVMHQILALSQHEGLVEDGWAIYARLHMIERAFDAASLNDTDWVSVRAGLGFEGMSRDAARSLPRDSWLMIALSHATGRDMREYLNMWGFEADAVSDAHIEGKALPVMPLTFIKLGEKDHCLGFDRGTTLPVDGTTAWLSTVNAKPLVSKAFYRDPQLEIEESCTHEAHGEDHHADDLQ